MQKLRRLRLTCISASDVNSCLQSTLRQKLAYAFSKSRQTFRGPPNVELWPMTKDNTKDSTIHGRWGRMSRGEGVVG